MKIKRNGISPSTWKKEVVCPYCNALLELSVKDISIRTKPKRNFWGNKKFITLFIVKCPNCNTSIRLNQKDLPSLIIDYLYKHRDSNHFIEDFLICYFS